MKKLASILSGAAAAAALILPSVASAVIVMPPPPELPVSASECKHGGWKSFGDLFKNQGDCVSFVATGGKNEPSGPAKH